MEGRIHSFESFGTVDGPGIRFVVFMQGCPIRCAYCHNPDTRSFMGGTSYTPQQVAANALKYKNYWGTRGGVTVTGGEPLAQAEFVTELFTILKQKGVHCCADTSGVTFNAQSAVSVKQHEELASKTDLFLLDIKHINNQKCISLTGAGNANTLNFAKFLSESGKNMWIRYVLVPSINDDEDTLLQTAEFIKILKTVQKVEVLPYHTMGIVKYKNLGIPYPLEGTPVPTKESIDLAKSILGA
ncbi:MAG: pyruvate formate lyase-activating protein [Clostridia bacterium]|nr:pyruvate formate lyase-activating protein [Clostridia bacterium]